VCANLIKVTKSILFYVKKKGNEEHEKGEKGIWLLSVIVFWSKEKSWSPPGKRGGGT